MKGLFFNIPSDLKRDSDFSSMTTNQLKAALAWKALKENAAKKGVSPPPLPPPGQVGPAMKFVARLRKPEVQCGEQKKRKAHIVQMFGECVIHLESLI